MATNRRRARCANIATMPFIPFKLLLMRALRQHPLWHRIGVGLIGIVLVGACERRLPTSELVEGRPFPSVVLNFSDGKSLSTQSFQGKMVVLNVWATWCPPCRREMPSLERLSHALDPKRFAVVGMSTDADEMLVSEFLLQNGITFPNFFDRDGKIAKQLGLQVYPETFLIAPDGVLAQRIVGLREWDGPDMIAQVEAAYQRHQPKSGMQTGQWSAR